MDFFDCHACYGHDRTTRLLKPVLSAAEQTAEMQQTGVGRAVVWRTEQVKA